MSANVDATKEAIRSDVRRLMQARTAGRDGEEAQSAEGIAADLEAEAMRNETLRLASALKEQARARCRVVQQEYRSICMQYCSPRPVEWPRVERPALECAFVEFRRMPHLRALVLNAILRLKCRVTMVYGYDNADFVESMLSTLEYPIKKVRSPCRVERARGDAVAVGQARGDARRRPPVRQGGPPQRPRPPRPPRQRGRRTPRRASAARSRRLRRWSI